MAGRHPYKNLCTELLVKDKEKKQNKIHNSLLLSLCYGQTFAARMWFLVGFYTSGAYETHSDLELIPKVRQVCTPTPEQHLETCLSV